MNIPLGVRAHTARGAVVEWALQIEQLLPFGGSAREGRTFPVRVADQNGEESKWPVRWALPREVRPPGGYTIEPFVDAPEVPEQQTDPTGQEDRSVEAAQPLRPERDDAAARKAR